MTPTRPARQPPPFEVVLVVFVLLFAVLVEQTAMTRRFNFDEFQVMYASRLLTEGRGMYGDATAGSYPVDTHFPLANILVSFVIAAFGKASLTILAARQMIVLLLFGTVFYTAKTAALLRDRTAALLAAALCLSCVVFVDTGIEIRHDVFNMFFNTMAAYWAVKHVREDRTVPLLLSALFVGLAVASTQKAAVWSAGIVLGTLYHRARSRRLKAFGGAVAAYAILPLSAVAASVAYLLATTGDTPASFWEWGVLSALGAMSGSVANATYPFLYSKAYMIGLFFPDNAPFYLAALCATGWACTRLFKGEEGGIGIPVVWAAAGLYFYLTSPRPFFQSFVPTVPALAVLTAVFLMRCRKAWTDALRWRGPVFEALLILLLLPYPAWRIVDNILHHPDKTRQMDTIAFCLQNLEPEDRVFSFTQQQIFFDSVLHMNDTSCGPTIFELEPACVRQEMIRQRCKIVIADRRTDKVVEAVREELFDHYISPNIGHVLVAGFALPPGEEVEREVWVAGDYYCPVPEIRIDGDPMDGSAVVLEQRRYRFRNPTDRVVFFTFMFDRERFPGNYRL